MNDTEYCGMHWESLFVRVYIIKTHKLSHNSTDMWVSYSEDWDSASSIYSVMYSIYSKSCNIFLDERFKNSLEMIKYIIRKKDLLISNMPIAVNKDQVMSPSLGVCKECSTII